MQRFYQEIWPKRQILLAGIHYELYNLDAGINSSVERLWDIVKYTDI
jgi:hypothetical protein